MITRLKLSTIEQGLPKYRSMLAGNPAYTTAYESIATTTVGAGGSATITFSSIPSTYTHLQIRLLARNAGAQNSGYIRIRFNSDTTVANYYAHHEVYGDGATVAAEAIQTVSGGVAGIQIDQTPGNNRLASTFGTGIIDILDYQSTNKNKTVRYITGYDYNGGGLIFFGSGLWINSSNAITSIELTNGDGTNNFAQYSQLALYGIKVA